MGTKDYNCLCVWVCVVCGVCVGVCVVCGVWVCVVCVCGVCVWCVCGVCVCGVCVWCVCVYKYVKLESGFHFSSFYYRTLLKNVPIFLRFLIHQFYYI